MDRTQKEAFVAEMHEILNGSSTVVVTHYNGLDVARISDLRRRMGEAGATFRVIKNRLTKLALKGTPYEALDELFVGPTAIAFSDDPVAAPKVAVKFAKANEKFVILGGAMGAQVLDAKGVSSLASLPSLDELRGKLIGLLQAPASKIARTLNEPGAQLARVFAAFGKKEAA